MSLYAQRGVSAQKEDVHAAIKNLDKGLYLNAFCKIFPDLLSGDDNWVNIMHADGAGTKSILAYLYWKETRDLSVWRGIAQDAVVMNLDDLICVGAYTNILFNSTIDRNKKRIPGEVLKEIIDGTAELFDTLSKHGINIFYAGGETADVGDVVRTIAVNGTMTMRWPKAKIITNENIKPGNVIVGLQSFGQATYETQYNSGIASNGLTSARHDVLNKYYATEFTESYENSLNEQVVYIGKHRLTDVFKNDEIDTTIGKLLLSPTRTFAPVLKPILENYFANITGIIHSSGGGQTKCMKYMPNNVHVIKDNLFNAPPIFNIIQDCSGSNNKEMYEVFNMGTRMEIYCNESITTDIIKISNEFNIDAQIIGRVEAAREKKLSIQLKNEELNY